METLIILVLLGILMRVFRPGLWTAIFHIPVYLYLAWLEWYATRPRDPPDPPARG